MLVVHRGTFSAFTFSRGRMRLLGSVAHMYVCVRDDVGATVV